MKVNGLPKIKKKCQAACHHYEKMNFWLIANNNLI